MAAAVVLDAALVLVAAAPVLLGVGPTLHPVGEASIAVVDAPVGVPHAMRDVHVEVIAAVPRSRAAQICVVATPGLLMLGPSEIPVRVPSMAVILRVMVRRMVHDVVLVVCDVMTGPAVQVATNGFLVFIP